MSLFPNVPNAPGVPPLRRNPGAGSALISLLATDAVFRLIALFRPQWGIFRNGFPVVIANNVVSFGYKQDWRISDYPIEQGAFESYNKVATPFTAHVRFSRGGSESDRQEFINSIAGIAGDLNFYDVVMPEETYSNVTIELDFERTASRGLGLIVADIWVREIRVNATTQFSSTRVPGSAGQVSNGAVSAGPQHARSISGVLMQLIPTQPTPSQTLNVQLAAQNCQINIYQQSTGLFLDLFVDNLLVIGGVLCQYRNRIVRDRYFGFIGDLMIDDLQGTRNPNYTGLGSGYVLDYLEAADLPSG